MKKDTEIRNKTEAIGYTLLSDGWLSLKELPEYYSFRCIIKFKEFGMDGHDKNHISTGYWWHNDECFNIDNIEMGNMTPEYFIPLYYDI